MRRVLFLVIVGLVPCLLAAPRIVNEPTDQIVDKGASFTLRFNFSAEASAQSQWFADEHPVLDATNRTLTVRNAQPGNPTRYKAFVTDSTGTSTTRVATVIIVQSKPRQLTINHASREIELAIEGATRALNASYFDVLPIQRAVELGEWRPFATLTRTNPVTEALRLRDVTDSKRQFYRTPTNVLLSPVPAPTGPLPVGIINQLFTDPSRSNRYSVKTNSSFMVSFWYPAQAGTGWPAPYGEPKVALANRNGFWPDARLVSQFVAHAVPNLPLATNAASYPVVFYIVGSSDYRKSNTENCEQLASHGFVVVAVEAGQGMGSEFPDGRLMYGPAAQNEWPATSLSSWAGRVQDNLFMLSRLHAMNENDPFWRGRLDLSRLGMFCWSFGVAVGAELCRTNTEFKAAVFLDGCFTPASPALFQEGITQPFLSMHPDVPPADNCEGWLTNSQKLLAASHTEAFVVQLKGATHVTFGDYGRIVLRDPVNNLAAETVKSCILSFLRKELTGIDDGLLTDSQKRSSLLVNFQQSVGGLQQEAGKCHSSLLHNDNLR